MWKFAVLICLLIATIRGQGDADHPIITTLSGQVQGERLECGIFCNYYSFKGIPYAEPPVGELRFRSPVAHAGWEGVRQATQHGNVCAQFAAGITVVGSEDCLFLNIYTQNLIGARPVMVWIHGGAFTEGAGNDDWYGPDFLVQDDVLLVTINYRLGILGFFSTGDNSAQGNYGMKDMVEALRWIRNNIAAFGGDPDNVTIFGESSGSVSVHFLVISAMANGLFNKAIAQSGAVLNGWGFQPNPLNRAVDLATRLNIPATTPVEMVEAMRNLPFAQIVAQTPDWTNPRGFRPFEFSVVVESLNSDEPPFLTASPLEILSSGDYNHIPLMMGFNNAENLFMITEPLLDDSNPDNLVPVLWNVPEGSPSSTAIANAFADFYWGGGPLTDNNRLQLTEFQSDHMFIYGVDLSVRMHAELQTEDVFYYMFSYDGDLNGFKISTGLQNYPGATHGDEMFYLFNFNAVPLPLSPTSTAITVRQRMVRLWTNFAKYSHPTAVLDNLVTENWSPVTSAHQYMDIGLNLVPGFNPMIARMNLWNSLGANYGNF